jgi:hypothetical protein
MGTHSLLVDRTICPDCRGTLDAAGGCTSCGLRLVGPLAQRLYDTLLVADGLVAALRGAEPAPAVAPLPSHPATPPPRSSDTGGRPTVPVVLLGLGALCVLVAAAVFVGVAWGSLGLGGRAAVLAAATGLLAAVAGALTRRRLWLGAGAVWSVVHLVLALDLFAARSADLAGLGTLSDRSAIAVVGATWLLAAVAVAAWSRTLRPSPLLPAVVFAVAGAFALTAAEAWTVDRYVVATTIAIPALGAGAAPGGGGRPAGW